MNKPPFRTRFCAAFESGLYRGKSQAGEPIDYHQIELGRHSLQLAEDYRIAREEFGISCFRDGAWLQRLSLAPGEYDWSYLDQLADVSEGQASLAICHYEWPRWATEEQIRSGEIVGHMEAIAGAIAERYGSRFTAYYPIVEATFWTSRMTRDGLWWPAYGSSHEVTWWRMYAIVGEMFNRMALAIKAAHPGARIGMSEPWNWFGPGSLDDLARPFDTALGRYDEAAQSELGRQIPGGSDTLLDIVGLNIYGGHGTREGWPMESILLEARRRYPGKELIIGETSHGFETDIYSAETWAELVDEGVVRANAAGADINTVYWAPFIDLFGDHQQPMPGGLVWLEKDDPGLERHWDPALAARFRRG